MRRKNLVPVRAVLLLVCWTGRARDEERNEQIVSIHEVLLLAYPHAANPRFWMRTFEVIDTP